jgi:hypothetical protein
MINAQNVLAAGAQLHAGLDALAVARTAQEGDENVGPIEAVRRFRAANPDATIADTVVEPAASEP